MSAMTESDISKEPRSKYFTCTLGEAAQLPPSEFTTVNELIDKQAESYGERPACGFPIPQDWKEEWGCKLLTYGELRKASIVAAAELLSVLHVSNESIECVALLCNSSFDFLVAWLGLMRAGFAVLLIAPQCQPEAIAHLCKSCDAQVLVYDEAYMELALSSASHSEDLTITQIPWQANGLNIHDPHYQSNHFHPTSKAKTTDTAYIHHTSGTSSGLPKPIPQTHHGGVGVLPSLDGTSSATFTTTPLYHGGVADCFRAWTSSALIWLFPGHKCPITTKNILSCLDISSRQAEESSTVPLVKYFSSVPYVLQMLAEDRLGVKMLQDMEIVGVGGAALPPTVGDDLVSEGIRLASRFGSAECGFLLSSHRDYENDRDWHYLRVPESGKHLLRFEPQSDETGQTRLHELIVLPDWPHMAKKNRPDGSFATSDLFEPHPTIANAWRYHSRSDSQITLRTGKKFDPAPLEDEISSRCPNVRGVLVFGSGKQAPGALVFPETDASRSRVLLEEEVWNVVKDVNSKSQSHTRLSRDMLLILKAGIPALERSSKGTLLRASVERRFSNEIEQVYRTTKPVPNGHKHSTEQDMESLVRDIVNSVLEKPMPDDQADFYKSGVDSTKCTQIRSLLHVRVLPSEETLPWNIVYDCENIARLSQHVLEIRTGKGKKSQNDEEEMLNLVQQYFLAERLQIVQSRDLPGEADLGARVVLLTGATGALGAHILELLRQDTSISGVICLARAEDDEKAKLRVSESLTKRWKTPLSNEDDKILCLPAKLERTDLGLSHESLSKIQSRVTHVIHAAWTVNFSLSLRSFDDNITGLNNLLNLVMSCKYPAQLSFCSSTASVLGKDHPTVIAERISSSPKDADALGYSQSKWVAEAICSAASKQKDMGGRIKVLRIGQLTGDTENGVWNMSEAWPMMLSTVDVLGCLPEREDKLSWLALDVAAKAVVDISLNEAPEKESEVSCPVFHVVNNSTSTSWTDLLSWIQEIRSTQFDVVDLNVWLRKLEEVQDHPAKKLLWLWRRGSRHGRSADNVKNLRFEVGKAERISEAMRPVTPVDKVLVQKIWLWLETELSN